MQFKQAVAAVIGAAALASSAAIEQRAITADKTVTTMVNASQPPVTHIVIVDYFPAESVST
ncbi:hypothetical protein LTR65_006440 [Meristemomyces frigidus]